MARACANVLCPCLARGVCSVGAGGGARNVRFISPLFVTTPIIVTIGAGGSSVTGTVIGNNGGNSSFGSLVSAFGGGGGGAVTAGGGGGSISAGGTNGNSGDPVLNKGNSKALIDSMPAGGQ